MVRTLTACLTAILLLAFGGRAGAAPGLGDLVVSVVDAGGRPVAGATVFVLGTAIDANRTGSTSADGTWSAELLRPGAYSIVVRAKGREPVTASLDVRADRTVRLRIVLGEALTVIGHVRSAPSPATVTVDAKSPAVRLSPSFVDAVAELSGVNVTYDTHGDASGLSIRGRDPSQTRYSFNGAEIVDPLRSHLIDPDVLQSARIDSNLDMVNFTTLAPTTQPNYGFTETLGGTGQFVERGTAQATSGAVGIAAAAVRRNVRSALDGATFLDTSGASYVHRGDYAGTSGYLSLVTSLGRFWRATASEVRSDSLSHPLATYFAGPLPYGYGGSVSSTSRSSTTILNLSGALPAALVGISISAGRGSETEDQRNRTIFGVAAAEYAASAFRFSSLDVDIVVPRANAPHLHVTALRDATTVAVGTGPSSLAALSTSYVRASARFDERFRLSPAASVTAEAGLVQGTNAPSAPVGTVTFAMGDRKSALSARYSVGAESPAELGSASFSRVGDASYDCGANSIRIEGPSDPVQPVRSRKIAIDASRGDDERSIGFTVYDERYSGSGLSDALVPATLQPAGYFAPGYLDTIAGGWSAAGGCAGAFSDRSRIFVREGISGVRVAYRGVTVRGRKRLRRFSLEGFVDLTGATLEDDSGRLAGPTSVYVAGRQLPGIPSSKLGATFGWVGPLAKTQVVVNATRTAANNPNRLPGYTLVTVGFERTLSESSALDVVLTNVGAAYVSDFTSPRYAVPLATRSGTPLSTVAAPLRVPGLYLRFRTTLSR